MGNEEPIDAIHPVLSAVFAVEGGSGEPQCHNRLMVTEPIKLTPAEARILGALIEKEITTPDYYPLTLNALINACNQRSNREPVMDMDEDDARQALHGLENKQLAGRARSADGRVTKYEHWLGEAFNFSRAETALICVLLLRGPQTPGELRSRTERMHRFEEIADVLAGLQKLTEREPSLVAVLARQPGTKEARYAHLLSGPVESIQMPATAAPAQIVATTTPEQDDRIAQLESTVAELKRELAALRQKIDDLFA
ncbi:MAG: YceH family protein [Terracidiphilus sp.]